MNWKKRLTNYNFWISIVSAVLLIFQAFNIKFDVVYINEIATAVLGLLVVIGIINDPTKTTIKENSNIKKEEQPAVKEEIKHEELKESIEEKPEVEIPIEVKDETGNDFTKDDFKVFIEKITADIHNLTMQIKEKETKKGEEEIKEQIISEPEQTEIQTYNIVN